MFNSAEIIDANMVQVIPTAENKGFKNHLLHINPNNLFEPFLEHRVISINVDSHSYCKT